MGIGVSFTMTTRDIATTPDKKTKTKTKMVVAYLIPDWENKNKTLILVCRDFYEGDLVPTNESTRWRHDSTPHGLIKESDIV